jgi:hypothetical protein
MSSQRRRAQLAAFSAFLVGFVLAQLTPVKLPNMNTHWYSDYREIIDAISVVLGVLALALTVPALVFARRHEKEMRGLLEKLGTQLIGKFPTPLADIALLIDDAEEGETIEILADCADYGSFFAPTRHDAVFRAIGRAHAVRHVNVRMVISGHLHHITHGSPYWEKSFDELHHDPDFRKHLSMFLTFARNDGEFKDWLDRHIILPEAAAELLHWLNNYHGHSIPTVEPFPLTAIQLRELLATCQAVCVEQKELAPSDGHTFTMLLLCREKYFEGLLRTVVGVKFDRFIEPTNLFFWMRSRHDAPVEAVFTYVDAGDDTRGLIFRTRERELLRVFRGAMNKARSLPAVRR